MSYNKFSEKWIWLILSVIVMIVSIFFNWSHWGDLALVNDDIHREFVTPIRLLQGEVLYKDFNFVYGFLPPYLNSWVIRTPFFDVFTILRVTAFFLFLLTFLCTWLICRDIGLSSIFWPVLFGMVTWTNCYTFNPSSFNSTYANFFAALGTWLAMKTLKGGNWSWIILGVAIGGALMSKPEGMFSLGLALLGIFIIGGSNIFTVRNIIFLIAGFILLSVPLVLFLLDKGVSIGDLIEGLLQQRFQKNLSAGLIRDLGYFSGIHHVVIIIAGVSLVAFIFILIKLYHTEKLKFYLLFLLGLSVVTVSVVHGQLQRVTDDFQNLGDFFGGLLGYWWYRQLQEGCPKKGFFILWFSSLGGWLRPLFHIGALVIPFGVGGGMLLAAIFWFFMLPALFIKMYSKLIVSQEKIKKSFMRIGYLCVFIFGLTGLYTSWNSQWKFPILKYQTSYGSFVVNKEAVSTQLGENVLAWLRSNLRGNMRIVAFEGLSIELILGALPIVPLSQIHYQMYDGDANRIMNILDAQQGIRYVLIHVRTGGYILGIEDYKLADYLDREWKPVKRFDVIDKRSSFMQMSSERKYGSGSLNGFMLYERNNS